NGDVGTRPRAAGPALAEQGDVGRRAAGRTWSEMSSRDERAGLQGPPDVATALADPPPPAARAPATARVRARTPPAHAPRTSRDPRARHGSASAHWFPGSGTAPARRPTTDAPRAAA